MPDNLFLISIISFFGTIVLTALTFAFSILNYNRTGSGNYNFFQRFPYELNRFKRYQKSSYLYLILNIASSLLLLIPWFCFMYYGIFSKFETLNITFRVIFFVLIFLNVFVFNSLMFIKLTNYRVHLIFATIFSITNLLTSLIFLTVLANTDFNFVSFSNDVIRWVAIGLFSVVIIFELFLMFNSTSKAWGKMVKLDCETTYRPKYCYLAILEWGNFLILYLLTSILMFIFIF